MSNIDPKGASFKEFSIFSSDLHAFLSYNGISHMEGEMMTDRMETAYLLGGHLMVAYCDAFKIISMQNTGENQALMLLNVILYIQ